MIQWFKDGKAIPRRYVWEIILGAYSHFATEESLVDLDLEEGVTVDVIGDVHGTFWILFLSVCYGSTTINVRRGHRSIL